MCNCLFLYTKTIKNDIICISKKIALIIMKAKMSIKRKLFMISLLLLLSSVIIYSAVFIIQNTRMNILSKDLSNQITENDKARLETELTSVANNVELFLTELENSMEENMKNAALTLQMADTYSDVNINKMKEIATNTGMDDLYFTDENGIFTMSTVPNSAGLSLYDVWDGYSMLITGEADEIPSLITISMETGDIFKYTSIPRFDLEGNRTGIIESALDAGEFETSLQKF